MGVLRPGQMLEGTSYQVVREIGAGGMGVVYEIEHVRLKKRYVAKVIHDQIRNDEGAAKRMEREAQVLAGISHPNIVQVHDIGTTQDGVSYFVMEKLEGVDLRHTMKRVGVTRLRAIEIVVDVLSALEYVHRRGIVHRDIKPENVFLAEQPHGTVTKVLDFGIVHIFDSDGRVSQGRITKTGGFVGTLYYAAPEQMQGKPAGPPNDVYAAGLLLFEMLAGKGPFDDDPGVGLSRCFKPAPLLTEFVPTAPHELSQVLARALEQDPARRPTAGELAAELRAASAALKRAPGAPDDEAVRAEVDDLLRHMAPASPLRPAAGRPPTHDEPSVGIEATAMPPTPIMAGAPRREPTDPRLALEATMASPTGEPPSPAAVRPAAGGAPGQPHAQHPPTMPGVGVTPPAQGGSASMPLQGGAQQPQHGALQPGAQHPGAQQPQHGAQQPQHGAPQVGSLPRVSAAPPEGHAAASLQTGPVPQRVSVPGGGPPMVAQAMSSPAASPRSPSAPDHGRPAHGGPAQLFASTMPVPPVRSNESLPGAPPRAGDNTSPGVYATVDNQSIPTSVRVPVQTPWGAIAAIGAVAVVLAIVGGTFAYRHKAGTAESSPASSTAAPAPPTSEAAASTSVTTTAATETATTASPTAPDVPSAAGAATTAAATHASPASPPVQPARAAAPSPHPSPPATPATPAKPATPATAASPRASASAPNTKPNTGKDDYMQW
ncbi:MAG: protein kinase [Labilithrix sp.]|nr:protein kinase [Labilithrix sp.]